MNKLALAAVALLVLALLALPRFVGSMTEARVRERVAAIDASPTAAAAGHVVRPRLVPQHGADRAALRPRQRRCSSPTSREASARLGTLPIAVDFAHGPIAVLDGVHFGWSKMVARPDTMAPGVTELQQTLGVPYLFEFRGRTSYVGALDFDADAPPFDVADRRGTAHVLGRDARRHLRGAPTRCQRADRGACEFTSPTGTFAVRGVYASADNELRSDYVMPGVASFADRKHLGHRHGAGRDTGVRRRQPQSEQRRLARSVGRVARDARHLRRRLGARRRERDHGAPHSG